MIPQAQAPATDTDSVKPVAIGNDSGRARRLCFFCCKSVNAGASGDYDNLKDDEGSGGEEVERNRVLKLFFVQVNRTLDIKMEEVNVENVCLDCFAFVKVYCGLCHQLKCLELQLNWQMDKLWNVMRYADRVPSRVKTFREWCNEDDQSIMDSEGVASTAQIKLRQRFKRQCKRFYSRSSPRVRVTMYSPEDIKLESSVDAGRDQEKIPSENTPSMESDSQRESPERKVFGDLITTTLPFSSPISGDDEDWLGDSQGMDTMSIASEESSHSDDSHVAPGANFADDFEKILAPLLDQDSSIKQSDEDHVPTPSVNDHLSPASSNHCTLNAIKFTDEDDPCESEAHREYQLEHVLMEHPVPGLLPSNNDTSPMSASLNHIQTPKAPSPPLPQVRRSLRQVFQCSICKATFSSSQRLETHTATTHGESDMEISDDDDEEECDGDGDEDKNCEMELGNDWVEKNRGPYLKRKKDPEWKVGDLPTIKTESDDGDDENDEISETESEVEKKPTSDPLALRDPQKCTKCTPNLELPSVKQFHRHNQYFHSNGYFKISYTSAQNMRVSHLRLENFPTDSTQHMCSIEQCWKVFDLAEELQQHTKLYHGTEGESFKCHFCDVSLSSPIDLINHELDHSDAKQQLENKNFLLGKRFVCGRCETVAVTMTEFISHVLEIHLDMPPVQPTCPICQQTFKTHDRVPITHYVNHHDLKRLEDPTKPFRCEQPECTAYFLTEDQLHFHWSRHHKPVNFRSMERAETRKRSNNKWRLNHQNTLICPQCPRAFSLDADRRTHVWLVHKQGVNSREKLGRVLISSPEIGLTVDDIVYDKKAKYFCSVQQCKRGFLEEAELENHSRLHGEFKCDFCDVVKTFAPDLAFHETIHKVGKKEVGKKSKSSKELCCPRCSFSTRRRNTLMEHHVKKHLGLLLDKKRCPICKYGYNTNTDDYTLTHFMIKHYHEYHNLEGDSEEGNGTPGVVFKCDHEKCSAFFKTAAQLEEHVCIVHRNLSREEGYECEDCGKRYPKAEILRAHRIRMHVAEEDFQFVCHVPECGKRYEKQHQLEKHVNNLHRAKDGKKQMECVCGKKVWGKSALDNHLKSKEHRKAMGEQVVAVDHICDTCGKKFKDKHVLAQHQLFHAGPEAWEFSCSVCNKKMATKQKLKEHMRTHTKEKPFVCQVCGVAYAHRHNLRIHVKNKHGLEDRARPVNRVHKESSRKGKTYKN